MLNRQAPSMGVVRKLSESDRAIIGALQIDGRKPYVRIADEVGLDERTVRRRIDEMRAAGQLEVRTVIDPLLLGYEAMALCGLKVGPGSRPSEVAAAFAALPAVDYVILTAGRFDILLEVLGRDADDLLETIECHVRTAPGVTDCELLPYLSLRYQQFHWRTEREGVTLRMGGKRTLDRVDRQIISILNLDGRVSLREIAGDLDVSESQVGHRLRRLVDGELLRIMAITNPFHMGFRRLAWLAVRRRPGVPAVEIANRLSELPAVSYVAICAGRFDLLAELVCVDDGDLIGILDREVGPIEGIASFETWIYQRVHLKALQPILE